MSAIRFALPAFLFLCVLSACKKENLPSASGQRLQTVISGNDSLLYTHFHYDTQNRLIAVTDSSNNGSLSRTLLEYSAQGKPVKFKVLYYGNSGSWVSETSDSLLYNDRGQVIKTLFTSSSVGQHKLLHAYSYDVLGRLLADTLYSYWSNEVIGYAQFTYDNSDNVVAWQQFYKEDSVLQSRGVVKISYDTQRNPYETLGLTLYFMKGEGFLPSRHNPIEVKYYDGYNLQYTYKYHSDGLPQKAEVVREAAASHTSANAMFFYE